MDKGAISRDDVLKTMQEYDELGGPAFLSRYGFRAARKFLILHDGREYDSKAVAERPNPFSFRGPGGGSGGAGSAAGGGRRMIRY